MSIYMVEQTFRKGLNIQIKEDGLQGVQRIRSVNTTAPVTWIHSHVSSDRNKSSCVYDGPNPNAIQGTTTKNGLPFDSIVEVRALAPNFYR